MKFAVNIQETLSQTFIVDNADNYEEAKIKVADAYDNGKIIVCPDRAHAVFRDDTETYIEIFGEEEFNKLEALNLDEKDTEISCINGVTYDNEDENTVRVRQVSQSICELFEDILEKHDMTIPDPDRDSQNEEARIYGLTYFNLEDDITNMLTELVNRVKRDEIKVISDTY